MDLQTFIDNHYEDGEVYSDVDGISFKCVEHGDEQVDGKMCFQSYVYRLLENDNLTDEYFEVTESSSNSGYWSDSERYDPEFRKVKPVKKIVEVTKWVQA